MRDKIREQLTLALNNITGLMSTICGVPCSLLEPWMAQIDGISQKRIVVANEGQAVAFCAGTWLAGGIGMPFFQNSGLGNAINPLTSLLAPFHIPAVCLVGWRGSPNTTDEPQHHLMGKVSTSLLALCQVRTLTPSSSENWSRECVQATLSCVNRRRACAILIPPFAQEKPRRRMAVRRPSYAAQFASKSQTLSVRRLRTSDVIALACQQFEPAAVFVATTGYTARELFSISDGPNKFYMVGSMGLAGALGLGIATQSKRRVVVLDGDGALLMHLGSLAASGALRETNFTHVLLNNGMHESTGGQAVAGNGAIDFASIASSCGYIVARRCGDRRSLRLVLQEAYNARGPCFLEALVLPRRYNALKRVPDSLPDMAARVRSFISTSPRESVETEAIGGIL